jgi:hypothetical protein
MEFAFWKVIDTNPDLRLLDKLQLVLSSSHIYFKLNRQPVIKPLQS